MVHKQDQAKHQAAAAARYARDQKPFEDKARRWKERNSERMAIKLEELAAKAVVEIPPPMAIVVILVPHQNASGAVETRMHVQWPPQMTPEGVVHALGTALQAVQQQVQQKAGGLWTPT